MDVETKLFYAWARYYDAQLGRFISVDPIIGSYLDGAPNGGVYSAIHLNLYVYCKNNPVNYKDPTGLFEIFVNTKGLGHVGAIVYNTSYDFGRYNGKYKGAWYVGPNLLKKGTRKSAKKYMRSQNGVSYRFKVSSTIDNAVAKKFSEKFKSYKKQFSKEIRDRMPKAKRWIAPNERYADSDWGLTGPNCVTFTESTIVEALEEIIEKSSNKALVAEARNIKNLVTEAFSSNYKPNSVNEDLRDLSKKSKKVTIKYNYTKNRRK